MQVVPFSSEYDQTFTTQLGGDRYVFDARWNERGKRWNFDLTRDSDQALLLAGIPLLAGQDVLAPYGLGLGGMMVADLTNADTDAGPDDFGDRAIVVFMTPVELAILAAAGVAGIVAPGSTSLPTGQTPPAVPAGDTGTGGGTTGGGTGGGGGGGGGTTIIEETVVNNTFVSAGHGFSTDVPRDDDTGDETMAYAFPQNAGANVNPTLALAVGVIATGSGTIRAYIDSGTTVEVVGTTGIPAGTPVGTPIAIGGGTQLYWLTGTLANPGGLVSVKVTIQSSAPGTDVAIRSVLGSLG
jgi:hypothetical protein